MSSSIIVMGIIILLDIVLMALVLRYGTKSEHPHIEADSSRAVSAMRSLVDADQQANKVESES